MEKHSNFEKKQNNSLDSKHEQLRESQRELRKIKSNIGYEQQRVLFLISHKNESQQFLDEGLDKIEEEFNNLSEVKNLKQKIFKLNQDMDSLADISRQEKQEKIFNQAGEKIVQYQSMYSRYQMISEKLQSDVDSIIKPGIDLGMSRESAIQEYLNQKREYLYLNYIESIKMINEKLSNAILGLEILLEETLDNNSNQNNKEIEHSKVNDLIKEIENDYFNNKVNLLNENLSDISLS